MQMIRSFSASLIHNHSVTIVNEKIFSLKSVLSSTIAKSRVFWRLLLNRNRVNGNNTIPAELSTKIVPLSLPESKIVTHLISVEKGLIRRIVSRWLNTHITSDLRRNTFVSGSGLSLGLVGVCVKRNGHAPSLITEEDVIESTCEEIRKIFTKHNQLSCERSKIDESVIRLENIEFGSVIAKGCNAAVYNAVLKNHTKRHDDECEPNLAVKMMFNYDAESNAGAIMMAMNKECIPFSGEFAANDDLSEWIKKRTHKLDHHPNIVEIYGVFIDSTPCLKDAFTLYPHALPARINEHGYGRNMTLFLAMKRYEMSLKEYLSREIPETNTSISMLTQLLEAVSFLLRSKVAHRDLKCDNILVNLDNGYDNPWLVITDFGSCCTCLSLPFPSEELSRGGNRALMAPEVITAHSGPFAYIDYTCSDLWSIGTIAYELFGGLNPFYSYPSRKAHLESVSYNDNSLPEKPNAMPIHIRTLVSWILKRNPHERPSARIAATACHIVMHSSQRSLQRLLHNPNARKLLQWLTSLSTTTICQRKTMTNGSALSNVELTLRNMFLSQVKIEHLNTAVKFIREN